MPSQLLWLGPNCEHPLSTLSTTEFVQHGFTLGPRALWIVLSHKELSSSILDDVVSHSHLMAASLHSAPLLWLSGPSNNPELAK